MREPTDEQEKVAKSIKRKLNNINTIGDNDAREVRRKYALSSLYLWARR